MQSPLATRSDDTTRMYAQNASHMKCQAYNSANDRQSAIVSRYRDRPNVHTRFVAHQVQVVIGSSTTERARCSRQQIQGEKQTLRSERDKAGEERESTTSYGPTQPVRHGTG